ncbi:hypothetical protein N665_0009s0047 [Sinapis alba]|nr:hypothetical protein N665_0009s0047 [Sinapis alba]
MCIPLMKNILVDLNLRVSDLLLDNSHHWNISLLNDLFYPQDIKIILKIKPVISSPGFFIWNHSRPGNYSVRTGYWLAEKEASKEAFVSGGLLPSLNGIKDNIWTLDTAPKIKIFLWKVISGALPVADNLTEQGMKIDTRSWEISNFPHPHAGFDSYSVYSNIYYVLKSRNNPLIPEYIKKWSLDYMPRSWRRFPTKGNSFLSHSGASWILRNSEGKVMMKGRRSFVGIDSKLEASFESWKWTIESIQHLHFNGIIFASDDHDLIGAISKPSAWPALKFHSFHLLLMVRSVIKDKLYQSYIAVGILSWLSHLFV